ncbi:MAG: hypothetical protein ABIR28_09870 [Vicinamibacteria bacterium]
MIRARRHALSFACWSASLYSLVLVCFLWPWPKNPARLGIENDDLLLHTWTLAWVAHQAALDPRGVFESNQFWPQAGSLSYTETLFPQSIMAAPILWLGGDPLLAHNLVLFASIVLAGVTAGLLALRLTSSPKAAFIAGFGYAFAPFRFNHLVQLGIASYEWFPLILLALWEISARPGRHRAALWLLACASAVQALSSGYYAVLLGFVMGGAFVYLLPRLIRKKALAGVLISVGAAGAVALLAGLPSLRLRERQAVSRGVEGPMHWSAVPRSFLDPGPNVSALGLRNLVERTPEPLFPGIVISLSALIGLARTRNPVARSLCLVVGGLCAVMSLGPVFRDLPFEPTAPFDIVRRIPPADMIRAPSRFGIGAILAIDVLAALGLAGLLRSVRASRRGWTFASLTACMLIEMRPSVGRLIVPIQPPPAYTLTLRSLERGPVLELPWASEEQVGYQLYWSTAHWQPMIAGYGGFAPEGNFPLAAIAHNFPTGFASRALRCAGVRYVVVHGGQVPEAQARRAAEFELEGLKRIGRFEPDFLFELSPWKEGVPCPPELPKAFARP